VRVVVTQTSLIFALRGPGNERTGLEVRKDIFSNAFLALRLKCLLRFAIVICEKPTSKRRHKKKSSLFWRSDPYPNQSYIYGLAWWMSVPTLEEEYHKMHADVALSLGLDADLFLTHLVRNFSEEPTSPVT